MDAGQLDVERLDVGRWIFFPLAVVPYLRRIRERYEENGANDVPAGRAFVGLANDLVNEPTSPMAAIANSSRNSAQPGLQARRATNSGKESPRQKAFVARRT